MARTYSFGDVVVNISHPSFGSISTNGLGMGSITVSMAAEKATSNVAADGTVIINKIKNRSGTATIEMQQTSDAHLSLTKLSNYLDTSSSSEFALANITITSRATNEQKICKGCSITKIPDSSYQAEAQMVSWGFICADVQNNPY